MDSLRSLSDVVCEVFVLCNFVLRPFDNLFADFLRVQFHDNGGPELGVFHLIQESSVDYDVAW